MAIAALPKALRHLPPPATRGCHLPPGTNALGQHAVLPLPRYNYVVTRSRPYPLKVLSVSGWRLGTQAECFASIDSALDSALYAVIDSVLYSGRMPLSAANARSLPSVSPMSGTG